PMRLTSNTVVARQIATHGRIVVAPVVHLVGATKDVSDERMPPRTVRQAGSADIGKTRSNIAEVAALTCKPVPENKYINGVAMSVITIDVLSIVSFEQNMMRSGHVRGI